MGLQFFIKLTPSERQVDNLGERRTARLYSSCAGAPANQAEGDGC